MSINVHSKLKRVKAAAYCVSSIGQAIRADQSISDIRFRDRSLGIPDAACQEERLHESKECLCESR